MRFPFVTRRHHEEVVCLLKSQITGLAKLLYPEGVPEEFQLLLGIEIPTGAQPRLQVEPEPIVEEEDKPEETGETNRAEEIRRLRSVARTNPSRLGRELERAMARDAVTRATSAHPSTHPSQAIFRQARAEAVTNHT